MTTILEQMPMTAPQTIMAKQLLLPRDTTVESAARLAERVLQVLAASGTVIIDFTGIRGVSSSYFNVIFRTVGEDVGVDRMSRAVDLRYGSDAQKTIGDRSWDAVIEFLQRTNNANGAT